MSDGEIVWLRSDDVLADDDVATQQIPIRDAAAITVQPDEILVVVMPGWVTRDAADAHRARFREVLGDRFILVMGDGVQLAKVKPGDWAQPALTKE